MVGVIRGKLRLIRGMVAVVIHRVQLVRGVG